MLQKKRPVPNLRRETSRQEAIYSCFEESFDSSKLSSVFFSYILVLYFSQFSRDRLDFWLSYFPLSVFMRSLRELSFLFVCIRMCRKLYARFLDSLYFYQKEGSFFWTCTPTTCKASYSTPCRWVMTASFRFSLK